MSYFAFFSYARSDEKTAVWLHRQLDGYSVPKALVGHSTPRGAVPSKLHPIYRDRTDQEAGGKLDTALLSKLEESGALIVLCTPAAARSEWVNKECQAFIQMGRGAHIFPVIASGEPNSRDGETECLPPALREHGTLAADLRQIRHTSGRIEGDGKEIGKLKLIAGLLGTPLDALLARERVRQRQLVMAMSVTAALFLGLASLAVIFGISAENSLHEAQVQRQFAVEQREEAERQRDSATQRLEYARQSIGQVIETLVKVDIAASAERIGTVIYSFAGEDGAVPCVDDAVCSQDREAVFVSNRSNAALLALELPRRPDPAAMVRLRAFCDRASQQSVGPVLYAMCQNGLPDTGATLLALTPIGSELLVTRYGGLGWCGSGGCTDSFTLWRIGTSPRALVSCDGDGFAVRVAGNSPTTAYCIQTHRVGCDATYSIFGIASYDGDLKSFRLGPRVSSGEFTAERCETEGTQLAWGDEVSDDEILLSVGLRSDF